MDGLQTLSHHDARMVGGAQTRPSARLAEVIGYLSLATDLATGQPIEHGLRRGLLAVWLGEELGLGAADPSDAYYVALSIWLRRGMG